MSSGVTVLFGGYRGPWAIFTSSDLMPDAPLFHGVGLSLLNPFTAINWSRFLFLVTNHGLKNVNYKMKLTDNDLRPNMYDNLDYYAIILIILR